MPEAEGKQLQITMSVPVKEKTVDVQIPNWSPGAYMLSVFNKNIKDISAATEDGKPLTVAHPDDNTWHLDVNGSKKVKITYSVASSLNDGAMHYSGPPTYLYVVGRKQERCLLKLVTPANWRIACGLDADGKMPGAFVAPTYDVLADNPVTMGNFILDRYIVKGKKHYVALRNPASRDVDMAHLIKACKYVSEAENDFWGATPYSHYVWHFSVNDAADGAGGLEHLSSTQIGLASGVGPRAVSVLSHEFFHLWNVKRVRSKPLGPFDYLVLPKTGALWWLEGVTDYYANLLLTRYGWATEKELYASLIDNLHGVRRNPARLEVSPYEASYRVGEAANGRGNSNGYKISYYNTGWLAGLCLDLEIRAQSGGKHSLDDVARALWKLCKNDRPGFEEDEIRKQCIHFGGPSLGDFYDRVIMKAGELPVEDELAKVGLKIEEHEQTFANIGFVSRPNKNDGGARVMTADKESPIKSGDLIIQVDGNPLDVKSNRSIAAEIARFSTQAQIGKSIKFHVKREGAEMDVSATPTEGKRMTKFLEVVNRNDLAKARLRSNWIFAGKKSIVKE